MYVYISTMLHLVQEMKRPKVGVSLTVGGLVSALPSQMRRPETAATSDKAREEKGKGEKLTHLRNTGAAVHPPKPTKLVQPGQKTGRRSLGFAPSSSNAVAAPATRPSSNITSKVGLSKLGGVSAIAKGPVKPVRGATPKRIQGRPSAAVVAGQHTPSSLVSTRREKENKMRKSATTTCTTTPVKVESELIRQDATCGGAVGSLAMTPSRRSSSSAQNSTSPKPFPADSTQTAAVVNVNESGKKKKKKVKTPSKKNSNCNPSAPPQRNAITSTPSRLNAKLRYVYIRMCKVQSYTGARL